MTWIQNQSKGTYLFLATKKDPATIRSLTLKNEIGTNAVVLPHHCRLIDDARFKKNKRVYAVVVLQHHPGGKPLKWISQEIGPGQSWIFDGRKLRKDARHAEHDPGLSHGM